MRTGIVLMALGTVMAAHWPWLPDAAWVAFLPLCALLAWADRASRRYALLACGFLWALLRAHGIALETLPRALEGELLVVRGAIADIPRSDARRTRFDFDVSGVRAQRTASPAPSLTGRLRLAWYRGAPRLAPGERWQLRVRLKRPRGRVNPGGFDYEGWLFHHAVVASGYVVPGADNRRLAHPGGAGLAGVRARISGAIGERLAGEPMGAIIAGLAVGDRGAMTREQWRVLRATGTSHLMAISGLHVGLVAALVYFTVARLWCVAAAPVLRLAAPRAAALAALAAALGYAGLAGFTLPTQRALVMLGVVLAAVLTCRRISPSTSLCVALAAVLLLDPFAVVAAGFWLSFAAVAVILWGVTGRVAEPPAPRTRRLWWSRIGWRRIWWRWGRVQWLVALGLAPVTIGYFLEFPLIAPIANLLAVPWAGFVLVPLVLVSAVLLLPSPELGGALLEVARQAADILWWYLERLAALDLMVRPAGRVSSLGILAACAGACLLLAPRGVPGRWLGALWLCPLLLAPSARPARGDLWLTLLDVGQGLSAVVRTHRHVLVYDAGPSYPGAFDAGRDVVAEYLTSRGIGRIDRLIISHAHSDHAGGAAGLLARVPAEEVLTNVTAWAAAARPCRAGLRWHWDGVEFLVLHPASQDDAGGNDGSCVLKIESAGGRLLLPGDAESRAESAMLARAGAWLRAEVLVAGHHGARTSSTAAFVDAVAPEVALFPLGYRNRFGFPHDEVVRRFARRGVRMFDTARHGAITLEIDAVLGVREPRLERVAQSRLWRARDPP
ncbi:MAG: DNA internalization-related competence protein ComEC/Rec2 [Gammaproteobacteria bacterium]|nr:DNA internalization-related competence protein ComEC/Rec2 [Gammaproteobacteria bacterium]